MGCYRPKKLPDGRYDVELVLNVPNGEETYQMGFRRDTLEEVSELAKRFNEEKGVIA